MDKVCARLSTSMFCWSWPVPAIHLPRYQGAFVSVLCLCSSPTWADFLQQVSPRNWVLDCSMDCLELDLEFLGGGSGRSSFWTFLVMPATSGTNFILEEYCGIRTCFFHMLDTCLKTCLKACLQTSLDIWRFWIASCLFLSILRVAKDPTDAEHSLPRSVEEGSTSRPWPGWRAPMVWWWYFL